MTNLQEYNEMFRKTYESVLGIKTLNVSVKADILDKYRILATAYYEGSSMSGQESAKLIRDNIDSYVPICASMVYDIIKSEEKSEYVSSARMNPNLAKLLTNKSDFLKASSVICEISNTNIDTDAESIIRGLSTFGIETAEEISIEDEIFDSGEDDFELADDEFELTGEEFEITDDQIELTDDEFELTDDELEGDLEESLGENLGESENKETITNEDRNSLRKELENIFGGEVNKVISNLINTFSILYRSGFESMPQKGILVNTGNNNMAPIITVGTETGKADGKPDSSTTYDIKIMQVLSSAVPEFMNYPVTEGDSAVPNIKILMDGSAVCHKLQLQFQTANLQYCKGPTSIRKWVTETQLEKTGCQNFEDWVKKYNSGKTTRLNKFKDVSEWYKWALKNIMYDALIDYGVKPNYEDLDKEEAVITAVYRNLKNVISVSERKVASNTEIRISTDKRLDSESLIKALENRLNVANSNAIEVKQVGNYVDNVLTLNIIFDKASANKSTLFAYEVLDNILESGNAPSWDHALLGKKTDGTYLFWDDFMNEKEAGPSKRCYTIYADSRSGKGVMTSTLVAAALCDKKQVFYTDGKPENGVCLGEIAWSRGKEAYVFNGTPEGAAPYEGSMEQYTNGIRSEDEIYTFGRNLPKKLFESIYMDKSMQYKFLGVMRYLKSLYLCSQVILGRAAAKLPMDGDSNWQIWIFDEMTKMSSNEVDIREAFDKYVGDTVGKKTVTRNNQICLVSFKNDSKLKAAIDKNNSNTYDEGIDYINKWLTWTNVIKASMRSAAIIELGKANLNLIFIFQQASWIATDQDVTTIGGIVASLKSTKIVGRAGVSPKCGEYGDGTLRSDWLDQVNKDGAGWWAISSSTDVRKSKMTIFKPFNVYTTALENGKKAAIQPTGPEAGMYLEGYVTKLLGNFGINPEDILQSAFDYATQAIPIVTGKDKDLRSFIYDVTDLSVGNNDNALENLGAEENGETPKFTSSITFDEDGSRTNEFDNTQDFGDKSTGPILAKTVSQDAYKDIESATEVQVVCKPMSYATLQKLGKSSQNANIQRCIEELSTKTFDFNKREPKKFGLMHLCWDISILYATRTLNASNVSSNLVDFVSNYAREVSNGTIELDKMPPEDMMMALLAHVGTNINNNDNASTQGIFNNVASFSPFANGMGMSEDDLDDSIDTSRGEVNVESPSNSQIIRTNGRNNIDVSELKVRPILLTDTNSINTVPDASVSRFKKLLFNTDKGTSYLFKRRTDCVIKAIKDAIKDSNAVTRVDIKDYTLVVNGRLVHTDVLIDDEYGVRFEDFVIVKDILKEFRNIKRLLIDSLMFEQVVLDYGSDVQSLANMFRDNSALQEIVVQYEPGGDFKSVTRHSFREAAAKLEEEAKAVKFKNDVEAVSAIHNPRIADKGFGYTKKAFDLCGEFGGAAKNQLLSENPHLFRAGAYSLISMGAIGIGVAIGMLSLPFKIFKK